jgi:ketosteroid isomerase-like protein
MSRENVELLRGMYDRFNRGDLAAGLDNIDADFVLRDRTLPEFPDELRGIAAYQGYLDRLAESFGDLRYEVESVNDLGDRLVVKVRASATAVETGVDVSGTMGHVWTVKDERATRLDLYASWDEALSAAGLSEP